MVKKLGLALGSGSFRGYLYVGVFRTLEKYNIKIDYIAGASAGALAGSYYAVYGNSKKLEEFFLGSKREKLKFISDINVSRGLIKGDNVEKMVDKHLGGADFKDAKIKLAIVATDLNTSDFFVFKRGNIAKAVRASTAVPLLFKPVVHHNTLLVDGGLSNPVPDNVVREMGADVVLAVDVYAYENNIKPTDRLSLMKLAYVSVQVALNNIAEYSTNNADIIIRPNVVKFTKISMYKKYFDKKVADALIKIGEEETERIIPKLKKLLQ
jgi:NTE family protein